jgi:hypothetical protein
MEVEKVEILPDGIFITYLAGDRAYFSCSVVDIFYSDYWLVLTLVGYPVTQTVKTRQLIVLD